MHGGFQLHQIQTFQQLQQQLQPPKKPSFFLTHSSSSSTAATASSSEYAHRMGEGYGHHFLLQPTPPPPAPPPRRQGRLGGVRGGGGEIVEVEGGHIVRSTGRKDRHSKVCTAKGPRDRRVRLSAHTAIQFYDVQDRLGYDRPSKAVDWLIKNARTAIDELAELPAWHPTATCGGTASNQPPDALAANEHPAGDAGKRPMPVAEPVCSAPFGYGGGSCSGSFLPPSLDSDAIADTIKSFFPIAAAPAHSSSPPIGYQNYPQDLRLSLQSFQDPIFHQSHPAPTHHAIFSGGSAPFAFDVTPASWSEQNQRMVWNVADGGGGSMLSVPPPPVLGQSQYFTQRGPLQSSNSTSVRAWAADPMLPASADHQMNPALHPLMSSIGFTSGGSFSGFRIPARIQGEEEHDGIADKPSSAPRH